MADTWPGLIRAFIDSPRIWAVAFAVALLGAITVVARRYGFIEDIPAYQYYPVVGAGIASALFIVTTGVQQLSVRVSKRNATIRIRKERDEFAERNFYTSGPFDRAILLHYKAQKQQRFRVVGPAEHFSGMARQALLDRESLDPGAYVQHYRIPDLIWRMLDEPPPGWANSASKIGDINWE